jgi:hypothetical protein
MEVVQPGLESKTFEFSGGTTRVQDAGKLVVRRYDEKSKGTFRFTLVSADAKPVAGAELKLQPISQRGSTAHVLTAESDGEGRAEILAYPLRYTYSVQAEGFNYESGNVEMKSEAAGGSEKQIQLHPAIQATVRVAWLSTMGGGKTSSEATLQVDGGPPAPYRYGQDTTSWIRPLQVKDQLTLQLHDNPFGFGGPYAAAEPWVRVIEAKGEGEDVDVLEEFTTLDLNKIDELKEKLRAPRIASGNQLPGNPRPPIAVTAEPGKIYVGRLQHRDMRTGQPVQLAFKAMVEEIAAADASAE